MARKLFVVILLVVAGSYAYKRVTRPEPVTAATPGVEDAAERPTAVARAESAEFRCDGRVRCNQMS